MTAEAFAAEQALLAAMLNNPRLIREAKYLISPADFYRPGHALLFAACCELDEAGTVVDPVVVMNHLNRTVEGQRTQTYLDRVGGATYLHTLFAGTFVPTNVGHYCEQIAAAGRMRNLSMVATRLTQISQLDDVESALDAAATASLELQLIVDAPQSDVIKGHYRIDDFLSIADSEEDWVVPDLLAVQDAMMWLGDEGLGKSWLLRQFALCIACGVNPMFPMARIPARKVLLVDVENAESTLRRSMHTIAVAAANHGGWRNDTLELLCRPGGMNLRRREDRLVIERIISDQRPDVVVAGPLYKLAPRGRDDWDTAAAEAREVLDGWRERYGVAFILEHHMPKGDGRERPLTPFGGSEWMRWVTHGRIIKEIPGSGVYECVPFRGDREARTLPLGFTRSGPMPWNPVWDMAEIFQAKGLNPDGEKEPKSRGSRG